MEERTFDPSRFWERPFPVTLTGGEMRVLWTGAVRYAMHRGTGASRMTADAVRAHLADLDVGTLGVIADDIRYDLGAFGSDSCPGFEALPDEIDREIARREGRDERR